jgi:acyl-coenzyme A thioesterase PaaI-like protein
MAEPSNPDFEQAVRESFASQRLMTTLGARLTRVLAGEIEIRVPFREALTQQHGFLHAGVVTSAMDSACGYAAMSLMPANVGVLSVEFKTNLLALTVCQADAFMLSGDGETPVATMLATLMTIRDRPEVRG